MIREKFIFITEENIGDLERDHNKGFFLSGIKEDDFYILKSREPDYIYGITTGKKIFLAIRKLINDTKFSNNENWEFLNHRRWIPRNILYAKDQKIHPEGGSLHHYYTSRSLDDKGMPERDFTRLSQYSETTRERESIKDLILNKRFSKDGNIFEKLDIGVGEVLWTSSSREISFIHYNKNNLIIEI